MRIHRVKEGECLADVAESYGVDERFIAICNETQKGERLSVGEELLILTPTRTYKARLGDSLARVSLRFGVPTGELYRMNPHIEGDELREGEFVAVRRDERPYGIGAANGIYYKGCSMEKLGRAMHFCTYITVGAGIYDGERCYESFNGSEVVKLALENGKLPLIRVYDKSDGSFCGDKSKRKKYIDGLINLAMRGGYRGILLAMRDFHDGYEEFLVELRGRMIGLDLILISEISAESPMGISDFSDGAILSCDKCFCEESAGVSFEDFEARVLTDFANKGEATKTFLEMPTFAVSKNGEFLDTADALHLARGRGAVTEKSEIAEICSFTDKRYSSLRYNSLSGIKRRLDLGAELGYMGISFDIGRCPLPYLLTYDALFKSVGYANVERRVRCNPDSAEASVN